MAVWTEERGLDFDQFWLVADESLVIEVPPSEPAAEAKKLASTAAPAERRRAVRVPKNLPRVIEQINRGRAKDLPLLRGADERLRARLRRAIAQRADQARSTRDAAAEVFL